jgi:hypothetical protein
MRTSPEIAVEIAEIITQRKSGDKNVKCPYLVDESEKKVCRRMIKEGKGGELSLFDLEHYCNGKQVYCYFFRSARS